MLFAIGCKSETAAVPKGNLTVSLNDDSVKALGNNQLTVNVIRDGSNETVHSITLSSAKRSQTVAVTPGMYKPVSSSKAFLVNPEKIIVNANTSQQVTVIPNEKGTVNIRLSDSASAALANSEFRNFTVYLHKDNLESIPVYKDWVNDSSIKTLEVTAGQYQLAYTTNSTALYVTPGKVTVNPGDVVDMVIDKKPFGIISVANLSYMGDDKLDVYTDSSRKKLLYRFSTNSNTRLAVEPGTYYFDYIPKVPGRTELNENSVTINAGDTYMVSTTSYVGSRVDVSFKTINHRSNYESLDISYILDIKDKNGLLIHSLNVNNEDKEVFLPEGQYTLSVRYPENYQNNYRINLLNENLDVKLDSYGSYDAEIVQLGKIKIVGSGISENHIKMTLKEITDDPDSEFIEFYTDGIIPEYIPSGRYHVKAELENPKVNTSLDVTEFEVTVETGKELTIPVNVIKYGKLEIKFSENAKNAIGPNEIIVELSSNGIPMNSYTVTAGDTHISVPEGNYSYSLEYEESAMTLSPDKGTVNVAYNSNSILNIDGNSKTSVTVIINDSIIGDSEITVIKNNSILSVGKKNNSFTYKWVYRNSSSTDLEYIGTQFDTSTVDVYRESIQLRIYSGDRLVDVIQAGFLFREMN